MRSLALILFSICLLGDYQQSQDDQYEIAFRKAQLENYLSVLKKYNVETSGTGAFKLLKNLLPNPEVKIEILEQIAKLRSKKFADRESAEKKVASFGPVALSFLSQAIDDGDPETRMRAGRAAEIIQSYSGVLNSAAIHVLKYDSSKSPSDSDRLRLLFDLCRNGGNSNFLADIASAIVHLASPKTKEVILSGIEDENDNIRISCVRSIKECVTPEELNGFVHLIESEDALVSMAAIESYGSITPSKSVLLVIDKHLESQELEVRRSAVNFLRAISMEHFGFNVSDSEEERKLAAEKWSQWYAENTPISIDNYERMFANANKVPIGLLVTVNGQGVRSYDLKGVLNWKLNGQAYDAQHVRPNVALVTFRSAGQVKLIQDSHVVLQTVSGLNSPSDADYLENGNVLVTHGSGIVTEHDSTGKEIRRFEGFSNPFDADRLSNGNTLIADSSNNRIVELDSTGTIVWKREGLNFPNNVFRLPDGRTLYSTYTSGVVGLLGVDGTSLWEKKIGNATLYSVYCAQGKVYVSDGANRKIWIMDMAGEVTGQIAVPESFCDVNFVTR